MKRENLDYWDYVVVIEDYFTNDQFRRLWNNYRNFKVNGIKYGGWTINMFERYIKMYLFIKKL